MAYHMDPRFNKPIVRTIWNYVWNKRINCLVGVTGRVGTGKSMTAYKLGVEFDKKFDLDYSLCYSIDELIKKSLANVKIAGKPINLDDFKSVLSIRDHLMEHKDEIMIKRGKVIIMDETAATAAYVRDFLSQGNKDISKLIQIWRLLGLVVIFVVPEDMKLAESTISRFLNIEIRMMSIDRYAGEGKALAWEYRGWNKKTREPIKYRMKGCRYGGHIEIKVLPPEMVKKYETLSKVFKLETIIQMGMKYKIEKQSGADSSKTIWDQIQKVKDNIDEYRNEKGLVTIPMLTSKLGISVNKAQQIRTHVLSTS